MSKAQDNDFSGFLFIVTILLSLVCGLFLSIILIDLLVLLGLRSQVFVWIFTASFTLFYSYVVVNLCERSDLNGRMIFVGFQFGLAYAIYLLSTNMAAVTRDQVDYFKDAGNSQTIDAITKLCVAGDICEEYKKVRLSCAEAGQISKCIEIKMQNKNIDACSNEGTLSSVPKNVLPSRTQYFVHMASAVFDGENK